MTCQCRKGARCADCMERDAVSRRPDSPAFYEERIRLLREALVLLADNAEAYLDLEQDGQRNYPDSLRLCVDEARAALGGNS